MEEAQHPAPSPDPGVTEKPAASSEATERSAERVGRNDATFRAANERIGQMASAQTFPEQVPFICECAEESCTEIVRLSLEEYERVRAHPTHFLNAPGHESAAGPYCEVVERNEGYVVVRKKGRAAEIAAELDPRSAG
jgi:hypothetical protein